MKNSHLRNALLTAALVTIGATGTTPLISQAAGLSNKGSENGSSPAGSVAVASRSSLPSDDQNFVGKVAQGGIAEVQLGQLAAQKAQSVEIKRFGERMVTDHSKANAELKKVASHKGITLPTEMDASSRREYDKLQKLSGVEFDREYMKAMVSDHQKDAKEFQKEAKSARDPDVKGFVDSTLPIIEEHLRMAQAAEAAANKEARLTTKSPNS